MWANKSVRVYINFYRTILLEFSLREISHYEYFVFLWYLSSQNYNRLKNFCFVQIWPKKQEIPEKQKITAQTVSTRWKGAQQVVNHHNVGPQQSQHSVRALLLVSAPHTTLFHKLYVTLRTSWVKGVPANVPTIRNTGDGQSRRKVSASIYSLQSEKIAEHGRK